MGFAKPFAVALLTMCASAAAGHAQNYPNRNITAIIPFAAGNANDITARIVLEQLGKGIGMNGGPLLIQIQTPPRDLVSSCESLAGEIANRRDIRRFCPFDTAAPFCMALHHRDIPASTTG